MYHPYFRGKQYELITIRDTAPVMAESGFMPIIEPVRRERSALTGLRKALDAVVEAGGKATVIVNPQHGEWVGTSNALPSLLREMDILDLPGISAGILLTQNSRVAGALEYYESHSKHTPVFIHAGFAEARVLAEKLGEPKTTQRHIFLEEYCGKLYQKNFKGTRRVLLRDGFKKRNNAEYPPIESFSDLHATYIDESMDGFGDFLIVGDDFNESGGPAYAVAIHLTFIDPDQDHAMQIYHFVSKTQGTPQDPAGKFAEALANMIETLDRPGSKVFESNAVAEYRSLHERGHFPGLGYVKKLSMNHHIETLANYLQHAD